MEQILSILLYIHALSGGLGLLSGTLVFILKKGNEKHVLIGRIFFWTMLLSGVSALILALLKERSFLLAVGVMTVYSIISGVRYLHIHKSSPVFKATILDWVNTAFIAISGCWFLYFGSKLLISGESFGIVFVVFTFLCLSSFREDYLNFNGKAKQKNFWLLMHISRMGGAYIASFTAFLVVNAHHIPLEIPGFIYWLLPAAIFTPLIVKWTRKNEIKN
jgi:hypothetical protein